MSAKYRYSIIAIGCVVLVGGVWWLRGMVGSWVPNPEANKIDTFEKPRYVSQLDGLPVSSSDKVVPQVLGIMIDNHPDARPHQNGLESASIVYEAPAEGGITRYLAIFDASKTVSKAGPVRSARPYFIDWIREYGAAPYLHSGGSPEALAILAQDGSVWDANEFARGQYFWRSHETIAPHNLFTSSSLWSALIERYSEYFPSRPWSGWQFDTSAQVSAVPMSTSSVSIVYAPDYTVSWKYNTTIQRYLRYINGTQMFDRSGKPIMADNVLVQTVKMKTIDDYGRKEIDTVGSGEAWILTKGREVKATWEKKTAAARTRFLNAALTDVGDVDGQLTPGVTWVQVVPSEVKIQMN